MKKIFIFYVVISLFSSCKNNKVNDLSDFQGYKKTDTLLFKVPDKNNSKKNIHRVIYSYTSNLIRTKTIVNDFNGPLYRNIIFDDDLCRNCFLKESHQYYSPEKNIYYCDTVTFKEVILINASSYSFDINLNHYKNKHQFNNRINLLFPHLKYLKNELHEYKDSIVDYVEFISPYFENNEVFFSYNNFKNIIFKNDEFVLKTMYVKKGLRSNEIWLTSKNYISNNKIQRR